MAQIPGGVINIGCLPEDANCFSGLVSTKNMKVNDFLLDRFEVRQWEFQQSTGRNPSQNPKLYTSLLVGTHGEWGDDPINNITLQEAEAYCRKQGKRLPTIAEWTLVMRRDVDALKHVPENEHTSGVLIKWYNPRTSNWRCPPFDFLTDDEEDLRGRPEWLSSGVSRSCNTQFEWCTNSLTPKTLLSMLDRHLETISENTDFSRKALAGIYYCSPPVTRGNRLESIGFRCANDIS